MGRPGAGSGAGMAATRGRQSGPSWLTAGLLGAMLLAAGASATWLAMRPTPSPPAPLMRFKVDTGMLFDATYNRVIGVAPDGRHIAVTADTQLWLRSADGDIIPLRGTEGARAPAFSPDSSQVGFWVDDQIKRMSVGGGTPVVVGPSPGRPFGLTWAADGFLYVGDDLGRAHTPAAQVDD